jgi:hypothetical protein
MKGRKCERQWNTARGKNTKKLNETWRERMQNWKD